MSGEIPIPTTVAVTVLDGNSLVGRTLELLLQGAGYRTRLLVRPAPDSLGELLDGVQLLILTPTPRAEHREAFLTGIRSKPETARLAVVELITSLDGAQDGREEGHVLWPCRTEELRQQIETVLSNGSGAKK